MTVTASADELARGYEALRAETMGELLAATPRGRAIVLRAGLTAWMRALPPSMPLRRAGAATPGTAAALLPSGVRRELVDVLAAMALGPGRDRRRAS